MPSLAKASENKPSDSPVETPLNQLLTIVEHKIRNLEKRKVSVMADRAFWIRVSFK